MKRIGILLCCIVLCLLFPEKVHAEEIVSEKEPVDIIFVIDCSGSMKTNDVSRMGLSMVQAFVDTVQAEDIRIGYVAYNDSILSYSAPKAIALAEEREALKEEIGAITYSRDTDIGLGVSYACELLSAEKNTRKIMVLISDGETDLPQGKERTEEQSNQELEQCVCQCQEEGIQIYTVAFGQYDGSKTVLEEIAMQTEAESYSAQGPEDLIEILYGIFQDNLIYQIQKFSSGTYAGGSQEIRCVLDALYLDEINIVLISSKPIGEATVQYGGEEILLTGLSHYAVGKIENVGENQTGKELIIHSKTEEGQDLYEEDAREIYRKWDNVKRVCEEIKGRAVPRKSYESGMWGISILTKDRVTTKNKEALQFGLVITLKEMYGKNRINEFIKSCMARNWLVTRLDVQNQVDIYTRAEEEIEFE